MSKIKQRFGSPVVGTISKPEVDLTGISLDGATYERVEENTNEEEKLAKFLLDYEKKMNPTASKDYSNQDLGKNNYNLYNKLFKVINIPVYENFVPMFDVVNNIFSKYKDSSYSEITLNRADLYFAGDKRQLKTFQRLVTLLSLLADPSSRQKNKRLISPSAVFNRDVTAFTEISINNIKKYYDL